MDNYKFHRRLDGIDFYAPSTQKDKKYDAYIYNSVTDKIYKISFGNILYDQYKDKIGYYSDNDHHDEKRRKAYQIRHQNDKLSSFSPGYLSYYYLWC